MYSVVGSANMTSKSSKQCRNKSIFGTIAQAAKDWLCRLWYVSQEAVLVQESLATLQ